MSDSSDAGTNAGTSAGTNVSEEDYSETPTINVSENESNNSSKENEAEEAEISEVGNISEKANNDNESVETESNATEEVTNDDSVFCNSCETCDKIFNYNNDIRDGMCDACIVIIADKENIRLPNIYHCDICSKTFKTKTLFKQHRDCDFKENSFTFVCEDCQMKWIEKEPFKKHMNEKHIRHICVRCRETLEGKENLDKHFKTRHRAF